MTSLPLIKSSSLEVGIDPAIGASLTHCRYYSKAQGRWLSIMPESPVPLPSSSQSSSFIMAPYSNRIRDGKFSFEGKEYQLRFPEKHAIHGDVRNRAWTVKEHRQDAILLSFDSASVPDCNYPFDFSLQTELSVGNASFLQRLTLTNCSASRMPAGFGFHPYFNRALIAPEEDVVAQFSCEGVYLYEGSTPLPDGAPSPIPPSLSYQSPRALARGHDHCFSGWERSSSFRWTKSNIVMSITADPSLSHLIVYTPKDAPLFAFEPATHAIDGFNLMARGIPGTGTCVLEPGASLTGQWSMSLSEG